MLLLSFSQLTTPRSFQGPLHILGNRETIQATALVREHLPARINDTVDLGVGSFLVVVKQPQTFNTGIFRQLQGVLIPRMSPGSGQKILLTGILAIMHEKIRIPAKINKIRIG
jgi:hypothetical protein